MRYQSLQNMAAKGVLADSITIFSSASIAMPFQAYCPEDRTDATMTPGISTIYDFDPIEPVTDWRRLKVNSY